MRKGKNITTYVTEYHFTKEELAILDPLNKQRDDAIKAVNEFVTKKVLPKIDLPSKVRYSVRADLKKGRLLIKELPHYQNLTKTNHTDLMGWGAK